MTFECKETQDTLVQNLLQVDEFGIGVFNYDILEHLTSKRFAETIKDNSTNGYNFFNVRVNITEYFSISFIRVIDSYGTDLNLAIKHENYDLINVFFRKHDNEFERDFIHKNIVHGHSLRELGLNVSLKSN